VIVAGAFILMAVGPAGEAISQQNSDVADDQYGDNSQWTDIIVEWYPLIILFTAGAILIGSAIQRRRQVRL
jgi:hypothetical protein